MVPFTSLRKGNAIKVAAFRKLGTTLRRHMCHGQHKLFIKKNSGMLRETRNMRGSTLKMCHFIQLVPMPLTGFRGLATLHSIPQLLPEGTAQATSISSPPPPPSSSSSLREASCGTPSSRELQAVCSCFISRQVSPLRSRGTHTQAWLLLHFACHVMLLSYQCHVSDWSVHAF